ncbi:MAG: hypothetical protein ABID04_04090 [Patescibacteria group bacterium]
MRFKTFLLLFLFSALVCPFLVKAVDVGGDLGQQKSELEQRIADYEKELTQKKKEVDSLNGQIQYMNSQIQLTALKITQTINQMDILEEQIAELSKKIGILDVSLDELSGLFINRVVATYKAGRFSFLESLLSSGSFSDLFKRTRYYEAVQNYDRQMLVAMEEVRYNYDQQKAEKEKKQKELEVLKSQLAGQKLALDQQKKDKEYLLVVTKNDEKKYQNLIAQALAELQAIQAIVAGQGQEKEIGGVGQGEKIATIISGSSPCSSGTHLHFEVRNGDSVQNPFSYLSSVGLENASGGDEYFFGGSWPWPINPPVKLTQGYGNNTWWIRSGIAPYSFHTGIDIVSDSSAVSSVAEGTLYNGSIKCGGGYLRYVKVKHKDSDTATYYLHINYEKI